MTDYIIQIIPFILAIGLFCLIYTGVKQTSKALKDYLIHRRQEPDVQVPFGFGLATTLVFLTLTLILHFFTTKC